MEEPQITTGSNTNKNKAPRPRHMILLLGFVILLVIALTIVGIRKNKESKAGAPNKFVIAGKVDVTADAFVPATIRIKKGETVQWTNTEAAPHQVATDPFPTEDGLKTFKQETAMTNDQMYDYTFDKVGTYTYHDHLNPTKLKGTVIVE